MSRRSKGFWTAWSGEGVQWDSFYPPAPSEGLPGHDSLVHSLPPSPAPATTPTAPVTSHKACMQLDTFGMDPEVYANNVLKSFPDARLNFDEFAILVLRLAQQ